MSGNRKRTGLLARLGALVRRPGPVRTDVDALVPDTSPGAPELVSAPASGKRPRRNRKREHVLLLAAAWLLPAGAALAAFGTPFLGSRAYDYLMSTGHFFVREVEVEGARRLGVDRVRDLAGIRPGTHVLAADTGEMAARLESHPWIAKATVARELPDRLRIRIDEHVPAAYVALDVLWIADRSGEPFAQVGTGDDLPLPIVTGLEPDAFLEPASAAVARADVRAAVNLARQYEEMGLAARWPLSEVRIEEGRKLVLVLSDSGTEAVLGAGPYRQKLYRLEWVLEKLHAEGKVAEYVLLDTVGPSLTGLDDGRVVVRADLAKSGEELAAEAGERAKKAAEARGALPFVGPPAPPAAVLGPSREAEGAPPVFDPAGILPDFAAPAAAGVEEGSGPAPVASGLRPAVRPEDAPEPFEESDEGTYLDAEGER